MLRWWASAFVTRQLWLRWRRWRLEAGRTQPCAPHHAVQFRRREVQAQTAVRISKDGFPSVPRPLEGQYHVAALGAGARVGQPPGDLLDGHRSAPLEERHDHQVEEVDLVPAQHILNAWHGAQADPLTVAVAHRAWVAVLAGSDHIAPSFALGAGRSGINPRRRASSCTSGGIVRASTMKPSTGIIQAIGFDSINSRRQNSGSSAPMRSASRITFRPRPARKLYLECVPCPVEARNYHSE